MMLIIYIYKHIFLKLLLAVEIMAIQTVIYAHILTEYHTIFWKINLEKVTESL